jgi:nicotinate-nucleotide--dimethylbenzimidazole phosphoribosyltransferase
MQLLTETLASITPTDDRLITLAQAALDNKTKPAGSLGRLEEFARRCVAIAGTLQPRLGAKFIYTFAGGHGVA